ncbi:MAG: hypothetical protein HYR72_08325 [Deltaproteobacteria bacterium]|nr:hypothetical protein [Deltaproteobacteria bacterium]MBI3386669.1 hypothetical protein [Deltaproteobacteria bacterium]
MSADRTAASDTNNLPATGVWDGFAYAALVGLVFFIYRASFAAFFINEDFTWLLRCKLQPGRGLWTLLTSDVILDGAGTSWRPLLQLAFGIEYLVWGVDSVWYHLISVAWHALAACALYTLSAQITDRFRALMTAMVFAAHPIQTESATWVCAAGGPMSGALVLFALWASVRWRQRRGRLIFVLGPFALALGGLESAAVLPALILTREVFSDRPALFERRSLRLYGGLAGVFLGFGLLRHLVISAPITLGQMGVDPGVPLEALALTNLLARKLGNTSSLMLNLPADLGWLALPAAAALTLVAIWLWWRGAPIALWGLLWIGMGVAPFALRMFGGGPRHLYLAVAGFGLVFAELVAQLYRILQRRSPRFAALCVSALLGTYLWSGQRAVDREETEWVARGALHREVVESLLQVLPDPEPGRPLAFYGLGDLRGRGVFVYGFEDAVRLYYDDPSMRVEVHRMGEPVESAYRLFYHPDRGFELFDRKRR